MGRLPYAASLATWGLLVAPLLMADPSLIYSWPYVEWGGAQTYLLDILGSATGFAKRVVLPEGSSSTLLGYLAAQGVPCETVAERLDLSAATSLGQRLRRRRRKHRAERAFGDRLCALAGSGDIVHVDVAPWSSPRLLSRLARRGPTFVTLHTRLPAVPSWRARLWRRRLRALTAMPDFHLLASSRDCRDSLMPYLGEGACARVPVAYPAFAVPEPLASGAREVARAELCQRLDLPLDRLLVVVAGQFIERKGCWTFLEAASRLHRRDPRPYFVWLGTGEMPTATAVEVARYPVAADAFRYLPSRLTGTSRDAFLTALGALADVFALPSFVEGLPLALGEAMALGRPVVASAINAVPEAIEHGRNGLLVPAGDVAALAEALERLVVSAELRNELGAAARATVRSRFDRTHTVDVSLAAYSAALARQAG